MNDESIDINLSFINTDYFSKCQPKAQHEFIIKGMKITAASKKDAIKKYNHRKNQANAF